MTSAPFSVRTELRRASTLRLWAVKLTLGEAASNRTSTPEIDGHESVSAATTADGTPARCAASGSCFLLTRSTMKSPGYFALPSGRMVLPRSVPPLLGLVDGDSHDAAPIRHAGKLWVRGEQPHGICVDFAHNLNALPEV